MLTFPIVGLWGELRVKMLSFDLMGGVAHNFGFDGSYSGSIYGEALWQGEVEIAASQLGSNRRHRAILSAASTRAGTLLISDMSRPYPTDDPDGSLTRAAGVTISEINVDNKRVKLEGVPAGFTLREGDLLGWQYGASPVRYALHEIIEGATANKNTKTPWIEVSPFIRPGLVVGAPVQIQKPQIKAALLKYGPGSHRPAITDGGRFRFQQVFS
jgi:hypothetical protein